MTTEARDSRIEPKADLIGADLSGVNLYGADLREADLREAKLEDARNLAYGNFHSTLIDPANYLIMEKAFAEIGTTLDRKEQTLFKIIDEEVMREAREYFTNSLMCEYRI